MQHPFEPPIFEMIQSKGLDDDQIFEVLNKVIEEYEWQI